MTIPKVKFSIDDAHAASDEWGANCGPGALAAILGSDLSQVRSLLEGFDAKRYTNPTMMFAALDKSGRGWKRLSIGAQLPTWGLLRIQWHGPWTAPTAPKRWAYRHTHWIGVSLENGERYAFDINCICVGGWVPWQEWSDRVAPWLIRECVKRGDGQWSVTHAVEVQR